MNNEQESRLTLTFIVGVNENSENIIRRKALANVKGDATDQELIALAEALVSLQAYPLAEATRTNHYSLM